MAIAVTRFASEGNMASGILGMLGPLLGGMGGGAGGALGGAGGMPGMGGGAPQSPVGGGQLPGTGTVGIDADPTRARAASDARANGNPQAGGSYNFDRDPNKFGSIMGALNGQSPTQTPPGPMPLTKALLPSSGGSPGGKYHSRVDDPKSFASPGGTLGGGGGSGSAPQTKAAGSPTSSGPVDFQTGGPIPQGMAQDPMNPNGIRQLNQTPATGGPSFGSLVG